MEYAENIVQLLADLAALLLCLFRYISGRQRCWLYAIVFYLANLLSCYYWTAYVILMGTSPNVSGILANTGWNAAFFVLFLLLMHMKAPEEQRYFHPVMLLPVPLNIFQLTVYLRYGPLLINLYQVGIATLLACFSLQGLCLYGKKRRGGAEKPFVPAAVFLIVLFEFGMWSSSCMEEPYGSLYYPFSFLCSGGYLFLVWAVGRACAGGEKRPPASFGRKYQRILKASSLGIVLAFSLGGLLLGVWMRDMLRDRAGGRFPAGAYDILPAVLFVISLVVVVFVVAVILVVYFGQKAAENSELREARQVAERSSAAKSEFLANMSHEIRTPINAVMGMNEIILRESREARDRPPESPGAVRGVFADICGYAGVIDKAGKNLLAIINDILDISRIEAGKLEIRESEYRLGSVLADVCALAGFRARSKGLEFRAEADETLPDRLAGDEQRIRQIVLNLLNNAVKYTRRGSVAFTVSRGGSPAGEEAGTVRLVFSVRDTGIGIRPEDMGKLFNKFERLEMAENSSVEGTGLGLAICRRLADRMGGSIRAESVYGEGSVFTAEIPQKVVSPEPMGDFRDRPGTPEEGGGNPEGLFRAPGARILVVDDTRMNLAVAEGLLKKTGIRIDTALGGEEALRRCLDVPYDVILMDQRMPGMDGTEALRRIRGQEGGRNLRTPVVCLTADAVAGAREKYMAEGFTDYLTKPVGGGALERMLARHLPAEKVLDPGREGEAGPPDGNAAAAEEAFAALRPAGFDVRQGLFHCGWDGGLYRSVLWEYGRSGAEKAERLRRCCAEADWKGYAIEAHSVKGVSAAVGAMEVSAAAARAEAAARTEDAEELSRCHEALLPLYRRAAEAVRLFCADRDPLPDSGDIMEFPPEE